MGCGKSSVGKVLAGMLSGTFIDLDTQVEAISGRKITEIFAEDGEAAFRSLEKNCLTEILAAQAGKPSGKGITVLSLGGGTLTTPECAEMIHRNTFCIYLKAGTDTLVGNLREDWASRPMLSRNGETPSDMQALRDRIEELMAARSAIYEGVASAVISTDGKSFDDIAKEISGILH